MRNFALGFVAALLVAGAIVAGILYIPRLTTHPPAASSHPPAQAAASAKPIFVGEKHFGAWTLICKKYQPPAYEPALPPRPCEVESRFPVSPGSPRVISANYSIRAPVGVLVLVFKVPVALVPDKPEGLVPSWAAGPGGALDIQWSGGSKKIAATYCEEPDCKATMVIDRDDEAKFLATPKLVLLLPAAPGKERQSVDIPIAGMSAAVAAMRKLEK